jgi:hypothetical protein
MNDNWEVTLEADENGDVILPFPAEMIKKYGWLEGDQIEWDIVGRTAVLVNLTAKQRKIDSDLVDKA